MEAKDQVLQAMREIGAPVNAGKIAEVTGLDRKVVDKAFDDDLMNATAAEVLRLCGGFAYIVIGVFCCYTKNKHTPTTLMIAPNTSRKVTF